MVLLPVLLPIILVIVPTRFMLSSRSSHARVKLLTSDRESMTGRLITVWASLEKDVEDVVEAIVEENILPTMGRSSNGSVAAGGEAASTPTLPANPGLTSIVSSESPSPSLTAPKSQPLLTPAHYSMMANLNALPNLTKHVAFINPVRNSHSIIICRSAATMTEHRRGEGVLRAWADGMKL
jgi:hypothetical protein